MDSDLYGFSEQDLIDMRFYCDITGKQPGELADVVRDSKDPQEKKRRDICYQFLSQKRSVASISQLVKDLEELSRLSINEQAKE